MTDRSLRQGFCDVDESGDTGSFVACLDDAGAVLSDLKRATTAALALAPGDAALDLGCGTGDDLRVLARTVGPEDRVVGVDVSESLVSAARSRTAKYEVISVVVGDAQAMPFAENEFSATRSERILMHLDRPAMAVAEMARVTHVGGRVVLTEPDWDTLVVDTRDLDLARRVTRAAADAARHPDVGRALARLSASVGLEVLVAQCTAVAVHTSVAAERLFRLRDAVSSLADAAAVSWCEAVIEPATPQPLFAALTFVTVTARKPPRRYASD